MANDFDLPINPLNGSTLEVKAADATSIDGTEKLLIVQGGAIKETTTQAVADLWLDDIAIYGLLGSQIIAEPIGLSAANISNVTAMVDGTLYIIGIKLKKTSTITGVLYFQGTQGNFTEDNENRLGLYSYSAGVLTLVNSCANDANLWKQTANTWNKKAFSSAYSSAPAGVYFIGLLYNSSAQVAAPATAQCTSSLTNGNSLLMDFTNSVKVFGTLATQNTLPSSVNMSALTIAPTQRIYVALY